MLSSLFTPLSLDPAHRLANRIVYQPMEGCDGTASGAPDELTRRRYRRFADGGPGLIWFEATAVRPEARANPRQLRLTEDNADSFAALVEECKELCLKRNGFEPLFILQATHSGRYSRPEGVPAPLIACNNPIFEGENPIDSSRILSDDYLAALPEAFARTAMLAARAGFDGIDIKSCHRYLLSEMLSAFTRPGRYGGESLENRSRLYREILSAVQASKPSSLLMTSRLNVYDSFAYPYGFGVSRTEKDGDLPAPDLAEPLQLIHLLVKDFHFSLLNVTAGNPYVNSRVNRPANTPENRAAEDPKHGVGRLLRLAAAVQAAEPSLAVVASGLSCLGAQSGEKAEELTASGQAKLAGFGRMAFAYPALARDLREKGALDPSCCCIACGSCTRLMRAGTVSGCPVRDRAVYGPIFREKVQKTAQPSV